MRSGSVFLPTNKAVFGVLALGLALLSGGCANHSSIRDGTATAVVPVTTLPEPDPRNAIGDISPAYYFGPQDKIDIVVYQLPELTKVVTVDQAGQIALPFVGQVMAGGHTPAEVRAEIASRLGQSIMRHPDVTVAVSESVGQRITVEGAVNQPGVYPVQGKSSLLQAIALARGTDNKYANEHIVAVFRTINNQRNAAIFDVTMIRDGQMADPVLYGNDTVVVERSSGKVLLQNVISAAVPVVGVFRVADAINRF
ncbi:polysaccharide export outer membrane protein [Sphingomonas sp. NFR15]|nr:polysaccharide export outer membrane protein [Sphingomonas sp. NFR15]